MSAKKIISCLLLFGLLLGGCAETVQNDAPALLEPVGLSVDTAAVFRGNVTQLTQFEGVVKGYSEPLWFKESGAVFKRYNAAPGDIVREGDILAELDTAMLEAQITALTDELAATEEQWKQYPASDEFQTRTRRTERERLQFNIKTLEDKRGNYILTAPFEGVISRAIELYPGMPLPSGRATVMYISSLDERMIDCADPDIAAKISANYRAVAVIDNTEFELREIKLSSAEKAEYRAVNATPPVRFASETGTLPSAGSVLIRIYGASRSGVLTAPVNAVHSDAISEGGVTSYEDYVYVMPGKVRTPVTVGLKSETSIELIAGVAEGDELFIDNVAAVRTDAASLPSAKLGILTRNVRAASDITFPVTETVTLPVNGTFVDGLFSGMTVREGTTLAHFTVADNAMAQREAKISLEMAEALPNNDFAIKRAREYYERLVLEGTDFDLLSPIAGYLRTYPRSGSEMYKGQPFASVNSLSRVQLKVTGAAAEHLKYDTAVSIHPVIAGSHDFAGHVSAAGSYVRLPGVEAFAIIDFDTPEEFADYAAELRSAVNNTQYEIIAALGDIREELLVPRTAVKTENTYKYVTILEAGLPRKRFILTGLSSNEYIQVLDGLEPGAALVY
ncbi:MAG: hypothetical protein LBM98_04320 [Oscillospiraceae bacterium]|nr:hypothetical protein [Oscillospiraceae bacterium]